MCGLGFLGLIMFGVVALLLLLVAGFNLWYATVLARSRMDRLGPKTKNLATMAVFLSLAAALLVILALLFVVLTPCSFFTPAACPVP